MKNEEHTPSFGKRRILLFALLGLTVGLLLWRAVHLQVLNKDFLQNQGDARHLRRSRGIAERGVQRNLGGRIRAGQ